MKELANSVVQLVAIIMILITLAVSTAAVSLWAAGEKGVAMGEAANGRPVAVNETARR